jgi:hypothetical protein
MSDGAEGANHETPDKRVHTFTWSWILCATAVSLVLSTGVANAHGGYEALALTAILAPGEVGSEVAIKGTTVHPRANIAWAYAAPLRLKMPRDYETTQWIIFGPELILGPSPVVTNPISVRGHLGYRYAADAVLVGGGVALDVEAGVSIRGELGVRLLRHVWFGDLATQWILLFSIEASPIEPLMRMALKLGWHLDD